MNSLEIRNFLVRLYPVAVFLMFLKKPFSLFLGLNVLAPLLGLFHFVTVRKIVKWSIPLGLLGFYSLLLGIWNGETTSIARSVQLILIFCFFNFLLYNTNRKMIIEATKLISISCFVIPFFEFIFLIDLPIPRTIFGFNFLRYDGIIGEPNFSAAVGLGAAVILFLDRKWKWAMPAAISLFFLVSRSSIMAVVIILTLILIYKISMNLAKYVSLSILLMSAIWPIFIGVGSDYISPKLEKKVNSMSSNRFTFQMSYWGVVKENPLGVGFFNSTKSLKEYSERNSPLHKYREPHHFFLHTLVDLGWVGFSLSVLFLLLFFNRAFEIDSFATVVFVGFFSMFNFLNGLHDLMIYLMMAYVYLGKEINLSPRVRLRFLR